MSAFYHKACFRARSIAKAWAAIARGVYWRLQGMRVGRGTLLPPVKITWPHQVRIGRECILEPGIHFKFDGIHSPGPSIVIGDHCFIGGSCEFNICEGLRIGRRSAIASGCKFIDHDHGIEGLRLDENQGAKAAISLGEDVWLGVNVVVLKGVAIADGAVVGAGAVVTRSIPPHEIWAGIPAKKIGHRKNRTTE